MTNTFEISAPISFRKGVDGESESKDMVVAGIASTTARDFDGETMNPKGFDTTYFENYGFINWAHQSTKDPLAIIGRPSKVTIDHSLNELFIESKLFGNSDKAKQVYKLGEILEAEGLSLAYSIEGKVLERDKQDPRKVLRAKITGCAITPTPKNNDSVATIVKGLDDSEFGFVKGMLSAFEDEEDEDNKKKSMDTASIAPLTRESVDKKTRDTVDKLNKGQVMSQLKKDLPNTSEEMLEEVYNFVVTIEKSINMKKPEVSPEALNEAYAKLGIEKGVEVEASTNEVPVEETLVVEEVEETPVVELTDEDESVEISDEAVEAAQEILKAVGYEVSKKEAETNVEEVSNDDNVEKGIGSNNDIIVDILKGELNELSKGFDGKFGAVATLFKGIESKITDLATENADLKSQIEIIGKNSQGVKSVTRKVDFVEKGQANEELEGQGTPNGSNVLSMNMHRNEILAKGDDMCGLSKGNITDSNLANAVALFESSGHANETLVKAMSNVGITLVK